MTRTDLLGMAKELEDRKRIQVIKDVIERVYQTVLNEARNESHNQPFKPAATVSRWSLSNMDSVMNCNGCNYGRESDRVSYRETFLKHNLGEILEKLRELFPDCDVSTKILAKSRDGTEYIEVSPFSQYPSHYVGPYIVVDWS